MVRITGNFQQERVLHPAASALLTEFFAKGWSDPAKLNQQSRQSAILLQEAKESFANQLSVDSNEIEFLGEVDLGFQLGIQGLLTERSKLIHSAIDRQKVFAVAKHVENMGRKTQVLSVNTHGVIEQPRTEPADVLVWQVVNGETGNTQPAPKAECKIFADCTSSGVDLQANFNYQTALFDSSSWAGPAGLGVFIIKSNTNWRNPLAHNDLVRVPNTFSLALALASSVALEGYIKDEDIRSKLKKQIIESISSQIKDIDIVSSPEGVSKYLSLSIKSIEADRLLLDLEDKGFAVDSGSACKSADMQPSHVLAAMGRPISGNIRLTLHKDMTEEKVSNFCSALKSSVEKLRGAN